MDGTPARGGTIHRVSTTAPARGGHDPALLPFHPLVREWFEGAFAEPTAAQRRGWPPIAEGAHSLILAPTGSGKTLAAFLWALNGIVADRIAGRPPARLLYLSPLKALNYDVERNLRGPLAGIEAVARRHGLEPPGISVAVRTGDTPQRERRRMLREHPDILITTPESLYLLLTSRGTEILRGIRSVIIDEIHAVAGTKRGAHMSLSLERLQRVVEEDGGALQRIGLSATQRPLSEIARFLGGQDADGAPPAGGDRGRRGGQEARDRGDRPGRGHARARRRRAPARGSGGGARQRGTAALDLAGDVPGAPGPGARPPLDAGVRQQPPPRRAPRAAPQRTRRGGGGARPPRQPRPRAAHVDRGAAEGGRPACLVATSSLELGIDMGAVDLVIQVESPRSVARGMQRIGRAGHQVGAPSRGRVFPKYRGDLLECAAVVERMHRGAIEETHVPRLPLDVLAQQLVAICSDGAWSIDDLEALARGAYPFAELSREQLEGVLDMLAGRYPSDEFAELRPRVVWDRTTGTVRGRDGARALAVQNAGTIPDRGLYAVVLPDGARVGELDEEMVYEARSGQTFMLGASTWRIEEITRDRVVVTPAPGAPAPCRSGRARASGRPYELGEAVGRLARELIVAGPERGAARLRAESSFDERAARNLVNYLEDQAIATGTVPSDRAIVVERFRDEIGDWRLCVLTPFGARVHAPWALAVGARIRAETGQEAHTIWGDDGIALHLPDADTAPVAGHRPDPARRARGAGARGARRDGAVRRPLPRERRPRPAHPAPPPRDADAAVAAAPEGLLAAPGGPQVRQLPGDPRDLPRVPQRLVRPAGPARRADPHPVARAGGRRGGDRHRVPVRRVAAVRVRRVVHVRGRHARRRAPGAGAVAQPRPAARAARPGGAARPDRPRAPSRRWRPTCRGSRSAPEPAAPTACTTCCAASATCPRTRSPCGSPSRARRDRGWRS